MMNNRQNAMVVRVLQLPIEIRTQWMIRRSKCDRKEFKSKAHLFENEQKRKLALRKVAKQ